MPKDPVTQYARDVVSGKIPSGKLQRLACERHLNDLKRFTGKTAPYYWDLDWCLDKLKFFPQLIHWRGELVGQPFDPMGWQMFCAGNLFGWFKRNDTYRFETAYISVPKKSGKSVFVGAVALLRGFFDGEAGSETYSLATTRDQADIVWHEAAELAKRSNNPKIKQLTISTTRPGGVHNIHSEASSSKFQPLSADRDSGDGVNPYCLVADEVHRYKDPDLLNMLQESMASRRNQLTIEITTAGWNRNSICYEHDLYSQRVLEGIVEDETWFAFICRADDEDRERWDDPKVWEAANPSWGVAIHEDRVRTAAKQAAELPSKLNDFLRYRLNIWTEQTERAIDMPRWIASGESSPSIAALRGRKCFAGLDLASVRDLAALALVFPEEESTAVLLWLWCPEVGVLKRSKEDQAPYDQWVAKNLMRATDGDTINHNVIRVDILKILECFDLVALAYDPHNSGNLPHELADVLGEDKVIKFYQGFGNMAAPCKELERLYLDGKLKHGNNLALNWMANNAAWRVNEYGDKRFDREKASEKIDGMVALSMAIGAWLNHKKENPAESVYDREQRGITIFG
jgi:phage terminase large subunit-like protein